MRDGIDELLEQFLIEGRELVQQASDDLLALERGPISPARIDSAFRAVHTLKGSVALFDFAPMGSALHAAEDVLGAMRGGQLSVDRAVIDALLDCVSTSDSWLESIAQAGCLPASAEAQGRRLSAALASFAAADQDRSAPAPAADAAWARALAARHASKLAEPGMTARAVTALRYSPNPDCFFLGDDPMALVRSVPDLIALDIGTRERWAVENFQSFTCNLVFEILSAAPADDIRRIIRLAGDQVAIAAIDSGSDTTLPAADAVSNDAASRSLRIDAGRIDALVDIIGELIIAKNGLAHLAAQAQGLDPYFARALGASQAGIERLVGDMHRAVMGMRMMPLDRTFRRLPRLLREIAGKLGKEVRFEIKGGDVEADKSIVDGLFEPLLHVLRNAVDHGIENAEARGKADKPQQGRVTLTARHEADRIEIAVTDDGAGIDPGAIRRAARTRGLMSESAIDALDDQAAIDLIFAAGFSTAAAITDISGRGVGMDAVRTAVEALGGRAAIASTLGAGSTIRLSLPRGMVVSTVMTVQVGEERFGVPIQAVVETTRIPADRILPIRDGFAFVLRDRTIPLLRLSRLLGLPDTRHAGFDAKALIVTVGDQRVGVEVDGFAERVEVLLRPMTGLLLGMQGFLGAALLGDGRVLMVLDLPELIG